MSVTMSGNIYNSRISLVIFPHHKSGKDLEVLNIIFSKVVYRLFTIEVQAGKQLQYLSAPYKYS